MNERKKAKAEGKTTYFDGTLCKWGHRAARYTSNGSCLACKERVVIPTHPPSAPQALADELVVLENLQAQVEASTERVRVLRERVFTEDCNGQTYWLERAPKPVPVEDFPNAS